MPSSGLKQSGFGGGLIKGVLPTAKFVLGSGAQDSSDHIICDSRAPIQ